MHLLVGATQPAVTAVPPPPARVAKRSPAKKPIPPALPAPAEAVPTHDQPAIEEILQPDSIVIFAEPERLVPPFLVQAPPDLLAQIDKMIEEQP